MRFSLSVAAAAALTTIVFLPGPALASCIQSICVTGHDEGNLHIIDFSTTAGGNVSHWNFNGGSGQRELGPHETQVRMTIPSRRPVTLHYAFQLCAGGGLLASRCGPWVNFTHTVQ